MSSSFYPFVPKEEENGIRERGRERNRNTLCRQNLNNRTFAKIFQREREREGIVLFTRKWENGRKEYIVYERKDTRSKKKFQNKESVHSLGNRTNSESFKRRFRPLSFTPVFIPVFPLNRTVAKRLF